MKKTLVALAALLTFFAGNAFAVTYTFGDNWRNWAGDNYSGYWHNQSQTSADRIGVPWVEYMEVEVTNDFLTSVSVYFGENNRQLHDALFINTYDVTTSVGKGWEDWDYLLLDSLSSTDLNDVSGTLPTEDGIYNVQDGWVYTTALDGRLGNPNGLTDDSVTKIQNQGYSLSYSNAGLATPQENYFKLEYDLANMNIEASKGFFVAYTPWCANDVIGGGTPVPEPSSLLLFGAGIFGLGVYRRMKK